MDVAGRVAVVTGGGSGIGAALCRALHAAGAAGVVVADIDAHAAAAVATEIDATPVCADVSTAGGVATVIEAAMTAHGRIDAYCSNAGVGVGGGEDADDSGWQRSWEVNVMAHVHAARAVLPQFLEREDGYFLGTVSAAGLLNHVLAAPYAATKAAALSFLEWLSIAYHDRGVRVSAVCPQGVRTPMLLGGADRGGFLLDGALEPADVARAALDGMRDERFLVLPHPEVQTYIERRAVDTERWLGSMRRLRQHALSFTG